MKIYTKTGDDGTTGLFYGGRVAKDSPLPKAYGAVDEAQAAIGLARAAVKHSELNELLTTVCRDLYVAMAELATLPENRSKLDPGTTLVTAGMVQILEQQIDNVTNRFETPTEFTIPGQNEISARLDWARVVVRRAERETIDICQTESQVLPYLNRLSDLLWALARWQEDETLYSKGPQ
ncbi:MAG: ATP:cob(I)alamin adenosyltransferase [Acidimicrobiaceae bacterium]|nr:ATP:cob(I)alamin adenosyltransferase [Acidimicrobiaceae bacterium]|tara:strand:- start:3064 stop:3600 length:537 start_codon:yes stop_codon:yes gene_type:complete